MAKRATPEINASSMADIAFLLLIFFLVTTTMDVDTGIQRQLPPIPENKDQKTDVEVNKRNIYLVLVNSRGNISVNQSWMDIDKLREDAKRFINCDRADDPTLPEMEEITVEGIKGPVKTSKGIISLQNDRGTTYGRYIEVQNELVAAYNEVRNEAARKYFNKPYDELNDEQQEAIRKIYPQRISEAEPKNYGGK
ncbi:MAG: biopolymer transporter ExbD [Bacteroidales bacterium]|jgi:biopolymer transport protein ExbD|nr:biopolymer transporter ExbD [Bacteroidales bacterium]MBQ1694668.1 biopolymer transporter ExbD [Bacteroidales bacterium]MBQ1719213.1 biopolymer transporter ExbD [Bacteroidales bacterium]MBQ1732308.1 biopolymer transporter ExbD [Bacteroidales bacterium]MBQ2076515.1 biopolymer transporter ExbD [Bacteroidales bacterium]